MEKTDAQIREMNEPEVMWICVHRVILVFLLTLGVMVEFSNAKLHSGLDVVLTKKYLRDFKNIPVATNYDSHGGQKEMMMNKIVENRRLEFLENELRTILSEAVDLKEKPVFTTALIAGDAVILDVLAKQKLLSKVPVIFIDTFHLFPETLQHRVEVENHL